MLEAVFVALLAILAFVLHPTASRCDARWSLGEGIRRDGRFACYSPPLPDGCGAARGPYFPCRPAEKKYARIYCTGGTVPIVVDERTVGCHMPH